VPKRLCSWSAHYPEHFLELSDTDGLSRNPTGPPPSGEFRFTFRKKDGGEADADAPREIEIFYTGGDECKFVMGSDTVILRQDFVP
jgi:hypothetical protein